MCLLELFAFFLQASRKEEDLDAILSELGLGGTSSAETAGHQGNEFVNGPDVDEGANAPSMSQVDAKGIDVDEDGMGGDQEASGPKPVASVEARKAKKKKGKQVLAPVM